MQGQACPSYDDVPEERYQFPRTYLRVVERAVGDLVVYYEPRRGSAELSSRGGRQAYFAVATVAEVLPDRRDDNLFYASIAPGSFLSFDSPVPFRGPGGTYERALTRDDGGTSKGAFGRAVRTLAEEEFAAILSAGFREDPWERSGEAAPDDLVHEGSGFAWEERGVVEFDARRVVTLDAVGEGDRGRCARGFLTRCVFPSLPIIAAEAGIQALAASSTMAVVRARSALLQAARPRFKPGSPLPRE